MARKNKPKQPGRGAIFVLKKSGDTWGWFMKRGGRTLAFSADSYVRKRGCLRAIKNFSDAIAAGQCRIEEE